MAQALYEGAIAAVYASAGVDSNGSATQSPLVSMYRNRANGNDAYADLDAIDAALSMTGGAGESALFGWGVFDTMGEVYEENH